MRRLLTDVLDWFRYIGEEIRNTDRDVTGWGLVTDETGEIRLAYDDADQLREVRAIPIDSNLKRKSFAGKTYAGRMANLKRS